MKKLIDALNAIARKHNIAASAIVDASIACLARLRVSTPAPVEDTTTPVVPAEPASDAPPALPPAEYVGTDTITTQIYSNDCKAPYQERCVGVMETGILMLNCGSPGTIFTVEFANGRNKLTRKFIVEDTPSDSFEGLYGGYRIRSLTADEMYEADLQTFVSRITAPCIKLYSVEITQNGRAIDWDISELDDTAPAENQPDVDATAPAEIPVPVEDTPAPVEIDYTPFINEMTPFLKAVFCFDATQSISGAADAFDTIKAFAATAPLANDDRVQKALHLLQTSLGEMTAA